MPIYEIEQYEVHTSKFRVQAPSLPEAIQKFQKEGGESVDDSTELIEVDDTRGMPDYEFEDEDLERLRELELFDRNGRLPGIRSVAWEEDDGEEEATQPDDDSDN